MDLRAFDQPFAQVLEVGRHKQDLAGDLKDTKPLSDGGNGQSKRCRQGNFDSRVPRLTIRCTVGSCPGPYRSASARKPPETCDSAHDIVAWRALTRLLFDLGLLRGPICCG